MLLWLRPETKKAIKDNYRAADCRTMSEFAEKAIGFYVGYLTGNNPANYLPNIFLSNMRAIADESDSRQGAILFKMAVEMAIMMNILAAVYKIEPDKLDALRGECVKEVKRLNGRFTFKDAVEWQKK